jgi:hypothetical protein
MALGDLNRFESVFAEAALGPRIWDRALGLVVRESESFGATLLPLAGVAIPNVPAIETSGETSEHYFRDGWHLTEQRHAGGPLLLQPRLTDEGKQSMQFDTRPLTPSRLKKFRATWS